MDFVSRLAHIRAPEESKSAFYCVLLRTASLPVSAPLRGGRGSVAGILEDSVSIVACVMYLNNISPLIDDSHTSYT